MGSFDVTANALVKFSASSPFPSVRLSLSRSPTFSSIALFVFFTLFTVCRLVFEKYSFIKLNMCIYHADEERKGRSNVHTARCIHGTHESALQTVARLCFCWFFVSSLFVFTGLLRLPSRVSSLLSNWPKNKQRRISISPFARVAPSLSLSSARRAEFIRV